MSLVAVYKTWIRSSPALLLLSLLVISCGSNEAETPKGYKRASTEQVSIAYPEKWRRLDDTDDSKSWIALAGMVVDGRTASLIAVNESLRNTTDPQLAGRGALMGVELGRRGFDVLRKRPVVVHGAQDAYRFDYIFYKKIPGRGKTKIRATDITSIDRSANVVVIRISGVAGEISNSRINKIAASIQVSS